MTQTPDCFIQSRGNAIERCGPETDHAVKTVAFCDSPRLAFLLAHRFETYDTLLNALQELIEWDDRLGRCRSKSSELYWDKARAAIDKATEYDR